MLEERINTLIQSIDCLTVALERLWKARDEIKGVPAPAKSAFEKEVEEKAKPETATASETPSTKELEDLCLSIVKDKPGITPKIKSTIKNFGGELIKDCPIEKLPKLKEEIMELAA